MKSALAWSPKAYLAGMVTSARSPSFIFITAWSRPSTTWPANRLRGVHQ